MTTGASETAYTFICCAGAGSDAVRWDHRCRSDEEAVLVAKEAFELDPRCREKQHCTGISICDPDRRLVGIVFR